MLAEVCKLKYLQPVVCVNGMILREAEHPEFPPKLLKAAVARCQYKK